MRPIEIAVLGCGEWTQGEYTLQVARHPDLGAIITLRKAGQAVGSWEFNQAGEDRNAQPKPAREAATPEAHETRAPAPAPTSEDDEDEDEQPRRSRWGR